MYIIGITGGIACGKSMVSFELSKYGSKIISADNIAHWQMEPGGEIYESYVRHFGEEILTEDGQLDRKKIGSIVFNDKSELNWINEITHPIILKYIRERLVRYQNKGIPLVVLDVPLLYEVGWDKECDEVWVVYLKQGRQLQRLMERNNLTTEEAEARIKVQMSNKEKRLRADKVIDNNGYRKATRRQIQRLISRKFPHLFAKYEALRKRREVRRIERLLGIG